MLGMSVHRGSMGFALMCLLASLRVLEIYENDENDDRVIQE
jgi:hypothetical protein